MADSDFRKQITAATRAVVRIEQKRRKTRKLLAQLDQDYSSAQRELRLLVQSVEPYTPPTTDEVKAAAELARERE